MAALLGLASFLLALTIPIAYFGYLWMLEIRSQLTWHDKLASTTVVRGRPPGLGHEAGREER